MTGHGKILLAGFNWTENPDSLSKHAVAELYDPMNNIVGPPIKGGFLGDSPGALSSTYITQPVLAPLNDGRVLIMGAAGDDERFEQVTSLYDPGKHSFYEATQSNFRYQSTRSYGSVPGTYPLVLSDGSVLLVHPDGDNRSSNSFAEIYIPDSGPGAWEVVPSCGSRTFPGAPAPEGVCYPLGTLPDGRVLASNNGYPIKTALFDPVTSPNLRGDMFLYDPPTRSWTQTGSVNSTLTPGAGVLIQGPQSACGSNCGKFLAAGGYQTPAPFRQLASGTAELYSPKVPPLPLPSPP